MTFSRLLQLLYYGLGNNAYDCPQSVFADIVQLKLQDTVYNAVHVVFVVVLVVVNVVDDDVAVVAV